MREILNNVILEFFLKNPIYWLIIIGGILSTIFYRRFRGFMGEFWVKQELFKLPKDEYIVLNDIMLEVDNQTYQIDHIVLSNYGIFVIEMKNFLGLIIGEEHKSKWIQITKKNKTYFKNPIHQNYGHIKALEKILNLDYRSFISIVCVSNQATLKVNSNSYVIQLDHLNNIIKKHKNIVLDVDIEQLKEKIKCYNIKDKLKRKEHIIKIKNKLKDQEEKVKKYICPKCGSNLIEKNGRYGKFIGCSNFPKCKYTKNI